jgi:hypothetical protein
MTEGRSSGAGAVAPLSVATAMAVLGVVVVVAAVVLLLDRSSGGDGPRNVFVNEPGHVDSHNTPTIARNPTEPDNVAMVHRVDRPQFSAVLSWSMDGGRTWLPTELPLPEGRDRPYAPDLAFSADGVLYVTYVNLTGAGNTPETLWLSRSDDGGRSLSQPVAVAGELALQARVVAGADGVVHVTWLQATDVAVLAIVGPVEVRAARSHDGGASFSAPTTVSDPERERLGGPSPVIDRDGDLVVLYQDFKDNVRDFRNLEGPAWEGPSALVLTRSQDGGATFSPGVEVESEIVGTRRFLVFLPEFPSLAAGPDGELYVVWTDGRHGDEDVLLRRSDDGGRTWIGPMRVGDNRPGDGTDQYLPRAAVAPSGRLDVAYYDRSHDPHNRLVHAILASSHDGGATFVQQQVSTQPFDSRVGPSAGPHLPPDFGSRLGLASGQDEVLVAWTDTRLGDEASARQDVVVAFGVRPARRGGGVGWWPVGAVSTGVLAAAGWRLRRRARGQTARTTTCVSHLSALRL